MIKVGETVIANQWTQWGVVYGSTDGEKHVLKFTDGQDNGEQAARMHQSMFGGDLVTCEIFQTEWTEADKED